MSAEWQDTYDRYNGMYNVEVGSRRVFKSQWFAGAGKKRRGQDRVLELLGLGTWRGLLLVTVCLQLRGQLRCRFPQLTA